MGHPKALTPAPRNIASISLPYNRLSQNPVELRPTKIFAFSCEDLARKSALVYIEGIEFCSSCFVRKRGFLDPRFDFLQPQYPLKFGIKP
jgi:hypothetical protein